MIGLSEDLRTILLPMTAEDLSERDRLLICGRIMSVAQLHERMGADEHVALTDQIAQLHATIEDLKGELFKAGTEKQLVPTKLGVRP